MSLKLKGIWVDVRGATAVEYGLIAALFVMGTIAGLNSLGSPLKNLLGAVIAAVETVIAMAATP